MLRGTNENVVEHDPPCSAELVDRINRALAGADLQVRASGLEGCGEAAYEFVRGARSFPLRVGLEVLAQALGILTDSSHH